MIKKTILSCLISSILFQSCTSPKNTIESNRTILEKYDFSIQSLSDAQYPDNPDIGFRSESYKNNYFLKGAIQKTDRKWAFQFQFITKTSDTIYFNDFNLAEFIPTIPKTVKSDSYLSEIACINQEWNRNQVQYDKSEFTSSLRNIERVDIARNCLNAYLWEIIVYNKEDGKIVPFAHGWFDFPKPLYAALFEQKNQIAYETHQKALENWFDPESKKIDLTLLRTDLEKMNIKYSDQSNEAYPVAGERLKKRKEVVSPTVFQTMKDLQSDASTFATFSPPGMYTKKEPRKTELGRFYNLLNISMAKTTINAESDTLYEIELRFEHRENHEITRLIIGGMNINDFPVLATENANEGWKNSMGIGNHTFYETSELHQKVHASKNPYYALMLDNDGKWLDSHKVGIDGPLFHFSDKERKTLHLWLLSFERHALVGHYVLEL
jgi:hypothetical protein